MRAVRAIDRNGLHVSSLAALADCLRSVSPEGAACLVDGFRLPGCEREHTAVVDGDARSAAIAAASVMAKVTRDRYMRSVHALYPGCGASPSASATRPRSTARRSSSGGICPLHRRSFASMAYTQLELGEERLPEEATSRTRCGGRRHPRGHPGPKLQPRRHRSDSRRRLRAHAAARSPLARQPRRRELLARAERQRQDARPEGANPGDRLSPRRRPGCNRRGSSVRLRRRGFGSCARTMGRRRPWNFTFNQVLGSATQFLCTWSGFTPATLEPRKACGACSIATARRRNPRFGAAECGESRSPIGNLPPMRQVVRQSLVHRFSSEAVVLSILIVPASRASPPGHDGGTSPSRTLCAPPSGPVTTRRFPK